MASTSSAELESPQAFKLFPAPFKVTDYPHPLPLSSPSRLDASTSAPTPPPPTIRDSPSPKKKRKVDSGKATLSRAAALQKEEDSLLASRLHSTLRLRRAWADITHRHESQPMPSGLQLPTGRTRALREEDDDIIDLRTLELVQDRGVLKQGRPGQWAIGTYVGMGKSLAVGELDNEADGASDEEESPPPWEEQEEDEDDELDDWTALPVLPSVTYNDKRRKTAEELSVLRAFFEDEARLRGESSVAPESVSGAEWSLQQTVIRDQVEAHDDHDDELAITPVATPVLLPPKVRFEKARSASVSPTDRARMGSTAPMARRRATSLSPTKSMWTPPSATSDLRRQLAKASLGSSGRSPPSQTSSPRPARPVSPAQARRPREISPELMLPSPSPTPRPLSPEPPLTSNRTSRAPPPNDPQESADDCDLLSIRASLPSSHKPTSSHPPSAVVAETQRAPSHTKSRQTFTLEIAVRPRVKRLTQKEKDEADYEPSDVEYEKERQRGYVPPPVGEGGLRTPPDSRELMRRRLQEEEAGKKDERERRKSSKGREVAPSTPKSSPREASAQATARSNVSSPRRRRRSSWILPSPPPLAQPTDDTSDDDPLLITPVKGAQVAATPASSSLRGTHSRSQKSVPPTPSKIRTVALRIALRDESEDELAL